MCLVDWSTWFKNEPANRFQSWHILATGVPLCAAVGSSWFCFFRTKKLRTCKPHAVSWLGTLPSSWDYFVKMIVPSKSSSWCAGQFDVSFLFLFFFTAPGSNNQNWEPCIENWIGTAQRSPCVKGVWFPFMYTMHISSTKEKAQQVEISQYLNEVRAAQNSSMQHQETVWQSPTVLSLVTFVTGK